MTPIPHGSEPLVGGASSQAILKQFAPDLAQRINIPQMFTLIDGVLPFEACLYYQVLPLFVEGSRIALGLVNPSDGATSDYVRRIVAYHNYLVKPHVISSEALQATLSAYLSYTGKTTKAVVPEPGTTPPPLRPPARRSPPPGERSPQPIASRQDPPPTLIVDSPDELDEPPARPYRPTVAPGMDATLHDNLQSPRAESAATRRAQPNSQPNRQTNRQPNPQAHRQLNPKANPQTESPIFELDDSIPLTMLVDDEAPSPAPSPQPARSPHSLPLLHPIPELVVAQRYGDRPIEALATLKPHDLMQELLGRVLVGGIGRLYFEWQSGHGRVLWSQDGVLQSVLEHLDQRTFQGVINELKILSGLSLLPITRIKQAESERLYRGNRLLLRFRFIPTERGEEATLQVLRGAALRFYKRQQLAMLERDALGIAKQLQNKISEIRDRNADDMGLGVSRLDVLPALQQLLQSIEAQIERLKDDEDPALPPRQD
ncbi:MAG: hypothetical protein KME20_19215 [Kaiparowitsia implicata GSE-PSE-MK54-09C]|jgi:hypothetical protein|nr:hypothetical protein [Kaiparowitsia implicata GSE-PSE-MK54-09C]